MVYFDYRLSSWTRPAAAALGRIRVPPANGCCYRYPHRKARALLAYLATTPGRWVERGLLATLLWEDSGEAQARVRICAKRSRVCVRHCPGTRNPACRADTKAGSRSILPASRPMSTSSSAAPRLVRRKPWSRRTSSTGGGISARHDGLRAAV